MKIVFILKNQTEQTVDADAGESLLSVMDRCDLPISAVCGGAGICGSCRVRLQNERPVGAAKDQELSILDALQSDDDIRLACQVVLTSESEGLRIELL
jgi:Na+-transporting NADH:ubiquinone oxidoreductase subunit F